MSAPPEIKPVETTVSFTLQQVREIYRAGIRRGENEATAYEWGSAPTGKAEDELEDALHCIANEGLTFGDNLYITYADAQTMFAQLATREIS